LDDESIPASPVLIPPIDFDLVTNSVRERDVSVHIVHGKHRECWSDDDCNSRIADAHSSATNSRRAGHL